MSVPRGIQSLRPARRLHFIVRQSVKRYPLT